MRWKICRNDHGSAKNDSRVAAAGGKYAEKRAAGRCRTAQKDASKITMEVLEQLGKALERCFFDS